MSPYQDSLCYLSNVDKFYLKSVRITGGETSSGLTIAQCKGVKDSRYGVTKDSDGLIEYVQDPEAQGLPVPLLKIEHEPDLQFTFTFVLKQSSLSGVTFVTGNNIADIDRLITSGYNADSNIQKHKNVKVLGDFSADSGEREVQYIWNWAPSDSTIVPGMLGGWKSVCSFSEFNKTENKFANLALFSFWIHDVPRDEVASLPLPVRPTRLNIPSYCSSGGDSPLTRPDSPEIMTPLETDYCGFFNNGLLTLTPVSTSNVPVMGVSTGAVHPNGQQSISSDSAIPDGTPEDGPVFRATLNELEGKTAAFRLRVKKVMKRAAELKEIYREWRTANARLTESIQAIASEKASLKPVMDAYINIAFKKLSEFRDHDDKILGTEIIEPLRKIYDHDIKAAEGKKREFEEESRDYYSFLSRYLSKKNDASQKKLMEKDSKYSSKKRNFELKRFDYFCYVQDLHGGRKEQDVLRQMTIYAEKQSDCLLQTAATIRELKPSLEALSLGVENARNDYKLVRTEREEQRRNIEKGAMSKNEASGHLHNSSLERSISYNHSSQNSVSHEDRSRDQGGLSAAFSPTVASVESTTSALDKHNLEGRSSEPQRKKEGILWALNKPGSHVDPAVGVQKLNWHKFWVTLGSGQITEYRDWKEGVKHSGEPIDLRMATVRAARNTDRRFCFEVITPHIKRVYQTTSEEELDNWIRHIVSAIEAILDGTGSRDDDINRQHHNSHVRQTGGNAQAIFFGNNVSRTRLSITRELNANNNASQSSATNEDARRILKMVREADPTYNAVCADCGSSSKVEWCSINLGVILCIECSGVHRSLGSHISKVRSLTLDTNSFNPDLVDLLCRIGNRISNSIYEATLSRYDASMKPTEKSSAEARVRYITAKYVDRSFVDYPSISPNDVLLGSLTTNNVAAAYGAIASRADVNLISEVSGLPAIVLSLLTTSPPSSPTKEAKSGEWRPESTNTFPLAELLLQNGAELSYHLHDPAVMNRLSRNAKHYINSKAGRSVISPSQPVASYGPLSPPDPRTIAKPNLQRSASNGNSLVTGAQKLQKRISSGGFNRRT